MWLCATVIFRTVNHSSALMNLPLVPIRDCPRAAPARLCLHAVQTAAAWPGLSRVPAR